MSKYKCLKHVNFGALLWLLCGKLCKKCTRLWGEARCEEQNVKTSRGSEHSWQLKCSKSARRCGTKRVSKSKCQKHLSIGPLKSVKNWRSRTTLAVSLWFFVARTRDCAPCEKLAKREGFVAVSIMMAGVGHLKRVCTWFSRGRRNTRDISIKHVKRSGRWFPDRGCISEHQIFRFAKMIWRDRRSTSYDYYFWHMEWKNRIARRIGTRPSALHSTFHLETHLAGGKIEEIDTQIDS